MYERATMARASTAARPGSAALVAALALILWTATAAAQGGATIVGQVSSAADGQPISTATVLVIGTSLGAVTGEDGTYRIRGVPAGDHRIKVSALGYRSVERRVELAAGERLELDASLELRPVAAPGIRVSVLRPDLQPEAELEAREVREANPRDSGELLRGLSGVDAVRRGPLGLDPVVRGLRETEVGTYLDGTRMFPAGPARMDSPLTHFDPTAVKQVEVVKGPYALTWGAGNLSAIRVETQSLPPAVRGTFHGTLGTGYDTNLQAIETSGNVFGRRGPVSYWGHGVWRDGDDYESGDGQLVPADFRSWEGRGKLGFDLDDGSLLTLGGGYQEQGPIDYPGRLLTAEFFETLNLSARFQAERTGETLRSLDLVAYVNNVDHGMSNREKPTAQPNPERTPPFALDVRVASEIDVAGGRAAAELDLAEWGLEIGGDVYSATRDAVRTIRRQEDQMLLFEDLMWPDATILDGGVFARASRSLGDRIQAAATLRLDLVRADADTASAFFLENTSADLEQTEANLSGAFTLGVGLDPNWTLSLGVGSAVRTADATERYSDRIPATKAQTSAEFMGNPDLEPERSTQGDLWLEATYPGVSLRLNAFARRVDDYITLEPTDLPKRLPLSPPTVFRYVNGDAGFFGFEGGLGVALARGLTTEVQTSYLWGKDLLLDEPALGIAPFRVDLGLRYEDPDERFFAEGGLHGVTDQNRVSEMRNEGPTDGYVTLDVRGGVRFAGGFELRLGVENLTDREYVNHLNARNPFTGSQIPEPGIVVFWDVSYSW